MNLYEQARDLNVPDSDRRNKLDEMIEQSVFFQRIYAEMAGEWEEYRKKQKVYIDTIIELKTEKFKFMILEKGTAD